MLSYQHIFHAGNLADVHKHAALAWALTYLAAKDKPLTYIETHAGRGLYDLGSDEAFKTGEAQAGVRRLEPLLPPDHPYRLRLEEVRVLHGPEAYPGSPLIAAMCLRDKDKLHLAELHPREHAALVEVLGPWGAHIQKRDGFEAALALCPPMPRRGMMLIDPSYEVKSDYEAIPGRIGAIVRKWNVGIIALWYPILKGAPHAMMVESLRADHADCLVSEVRFPPARDGHGMVGSGLLVVNPPFGMAEEARRIEAVFRGLR